MEKESKATPEQDQTATHVPLTEEQIRSAQLGVLLFRNWLRSHASDHQLYERTKRELALVDWKYMQNYADAKTEVVEEILARAQGNANEQVHEDD